MEHKHSGATSGCGWWPQPAASPQPRVVQGAQSAPFTQSTMHAHGLHLQEPADHLVASQTACGLPACSLSLPRFFQVHEDEIVLLFHSGLCDFVLPIKTVTPRATEGLAELFTKA